jgi:hypothetical protein
MYVGHDNRLQRPALVSSLAVDVMYYNAPTVWAIERMLAQTIGKDLEGCGRGANRGHVRTFAWRL